MNGTTTKDKVPYNLIQQNIFFLYKMLLNLQLRRVLQYNHCLYTINK